MAYTGPMISSTVPNKKERKQSEDEFGINNSVASLQQENNFQMIKPEVARAQFDTAYNHLSTSKDNITPSTTPTENDKKKLKSEESDAINFND